MPRRLAVALLAASLFTVAPLEASLSAAATGPSSESTETPAPAASPSADAEPQTVDEAQHDLEHSSAALRSAVEARDAADLELATARAAADDAHSRLRRARAVAGGAALEAQRAQSAYTVAQEAQETAEIALADQRADFGRLVRAAYQHGPSTDIAVLLNARDPRELTERFHVVRGVLRVESGGVNGLATLQAEAEDRTQELDRARDRSARSHQAAEHRAHEVEQVAAEVLAAKTTLEAAVRRHAQAVAAAEAAVLEDQRQYDELRAEADRLAALQREQAREAVPSIDAGTGTAAPGAGVLQAPVIGPVTSKFGMRVHPITGVYKLHTGTDYGVGCGTPVGAARGGTVSEAGWNPAYGNRVILVHGLVDGAWLTTTYNHLEAIDVAPGQDVPTGASVGRVGSTGYSTGCHLHFELLVNGEFVDPEEWL